MLCLLSCARPMQGYAHKTHFCAHVTNPQRCTLGGSCNREVQKTFGVCKNEATSFPIFHTRSTHRWLNIYLEYSLSVPSSELGPHPLPRKRVCYSPLPTGTKGGERHTPTLAHSHSYKFWRFFCQISEKLWRHQYSYYSYLCFLRQPDRPSAIQAYTNRKEGMQYTVDMSLNFKLQTEGNFTKIQAIGRQTD